RVKTVLVGIDLRFHEIEQAFLKLAAARRMLEVHGLPLDFLSQRCCKWHVPEKWIPVFRKGHAQKHFRPYHIGRTRCSRRNGLSTLSPISARSSDPANGC